MKKRQKNILMVFIGVVGLLPALPFLYAAGYVLFSSVYLEIQIRRPAVYKTYTHYLANFISNIDNWNEDDRSDPFAPYMIGKTWQPESFDVFPNMCIMIQPDSAIVVFGGGFYPLAYSLGLNEEQSDETEIVWDLYISHEERGPKIYTYHFPINNGEYFKQIFTDAVDRYDTLIQSEPDNENHQTAKRNFLKLFNDPNSLLLKDYQ